MCAVFQRLPLAMVTLLALLPVLTPSPQALAAPLSSGPNPSDFGIRQHGFNPRAKRSIIPLIEGVANYWLRCAWLDYPVLINVYFALLQIGRDQCNARKISVGSDKRGQFKKRGENEKERAVDSVCSHRDTINNRNHHHHPQTSDTSTHCKNHETSCSDNDPSPAKPHPQCSHCGASSHSSTHSPTCPCCSSHSIPIHLDPSDSSPINSNPCHPFPIHRSPSCSWTANLSEASQKSCISRPGDIYVQEPAILISGGGGAFLCQSKNDHLKICSSYMSFLFSDPNLWYS